MSVSMLDSASPPTAAQAGQLYARGHRVYVGYLPPSAGWHSAVWSPADFARVRAAGFAVIGCIFGPDTAHALAAAAAAGVDTVALDVEAGDPGAYAPTWAAEMTGKVRTVLYGTADQIRAHGWLFDAVWIAQRSSGPPRRPMPATAVQWWGTHTEAGLAVDESLADEWYLSGAPPPPPTGGSSPMTAQEVAAHVAVVYALCGHPLQDVHDPQGFQNQVDAVMSGAADLHTVTNNILTALGVPAPSAGPPGHDGAPGKDGAPGAPGPAYDDAAVRAGIAGIEQELAAVKAAL